MRNDNWDLRTRNSVHSNISGGGNVGSGNSESGHDGCCGGDEEFQGNDQRGKYKYRVSIRRWLMLKFR